MKALLILLNVAAIGIAFGMVALFDWSGPGFVWGMICGLILFGTYTRFKLGYWI